MPLMTRIRQYAAKIETTAGTQIALAAANATDRIMDPTLTIVRPGVLLDNQGGLGPMDVVPADASVATGFRLWCNGSGANGTPPDWFKYAQAAGLVLSTASLATTDTTSSWSTLSAGLYRAGRAFLGRGIMYNLKFGFTAGKPIEMTADGKGGFIANPTDVAQLSGITYNTTQPPVWAGTGSLSFGGSAAIKVAKLDIDLGNEVALREDPSQPGGYFGGWIGNRVTRVTMDPESALVATRTFHQMQSDSTSNALVLVAGTVAGNILTFTLAGLKVENPPEEGDRDGKSVENVSFVCTGGMTLAMT